MHLLMLVAFSLAIGFATASANAQSPENQPRTIQAYAAGCDLYMFGGMPVLKVNLYETQAEARASKTSPKKPRTDVILEYGPGLALSKANPTSAVRLICGVISKLGAESTITVRTNSNNIVEAVMINGQEAQSDSFALMPPNAQQTIAELLKALMQKEMQQQEEEQEEQSPLPPLLEA